MDKELEKYLDIIKLRRNIVFNTLFLEITNACNYKCKHCYNSSGDKKTTEFTTEEFNKIINEFLKFNIKSVVLSGGEALLHSYIWKFIDILKTYNLDVTLLTNGKLLSNENVERLKRKKVYIQISLDGATADTNDFIRKSGSFIDVMNALNVLNNQNYTERLSINTVLNKINHGEIANIIKICEQFSVSVIGFNFLNNLGRAKGNEYNINDAELYNTIDEISKYQYNKNVDVKPLGIARECRFCGSEKDLYLSPVVDVRGNVYMCEFLRDEIFSIGNILKHPLKDILESEALKRNLLLLNIRQFYIPSCKKCSVKSMCGAGCIAQNYNNNYFQPQFCKLMKKNIIHRLEVVKS